MERKLEALRDLLGRVSDRLVAEELAEEIGLLVQTYEDEVCMLQRELRASMLENSSLLHIQNKKKCFSIYEC